MGKVEVGLDYDTLSRKGLDSQVEPLRRVVEAQIAIVVKEVDVE